MTKDIADLSFRHDKASTFDRTNDVGAAKHQLPSDIEDSYPLSPLQHGMLFHAVLEKGSGVDIEQPVIDLHETLDVNKFRSAWQQVISRHPILRTSFHWEGLEQPQQKVHVKVKLPWDEQNWSAVGDAEREKRFADFLAVDRRRGFEMEQAPLFRLTLLRYGAANYRLIWTYHHVLMDGRTRELLLQELFAFYAAFLRGESISLPQPRKFRDYVDWLNQKDFDQDEDFWRQRLKGFLTPTPLSVDRSLDNHGAGTTYSSRSTKLSAGTTSALRSVADKNGLTLNTLVQGAWAILLSRYSGETDVVFGTVRSNRRGTIDGADDVTGLCINTLPMRVNADAKSPLLSLLNDVRAQWVSLREHAHTPLAKIQSWSELPANFPLFASIVNFQSYLLDTKWQTRGGVWSNRRIEFNPQSNYLILAAYDGEELELKIRFYLDRICNDDAKRMLGHVQTLLEGIANNPQCRVGELSLLSSSERHQLLVEWNQTEVNYPKDKCIHQLFEDMAKRTPDAVAAVFEDELLTYRELNNRANQIAHRLQALGVGPDVLVGLCVERSLSMILGLLGILKAGGAYVPIDPSYPEETVAFMLADANVSLLLTQQNLVQTLPALNKTTKVVCVDSLGCELSTGSVDNLACTAVAENLAYVIYTSGSTGKPKGIMIPHQAIVNHMRWMQSVFPLDESDRVLQKTPFSFDASVWEFYAPLLVGGRLVIARQNGHRDPAYLAEMVVQHGITILQLVPSLLRAFLEIPEVKACHSLRHVFCGGEPLTPDVCRRFYEILRADLHNLYGPTEVTIDSLFYSVPRDDLAEAVPIGRPVANTQAYVLDRHKQPVPVGVPGELHLGGVQVARGYLNQPELTADKFIPNPFSPGTLLYCTGDFVRYEPDGKIEFIGRIDDQVKIRGHRIELGEVEATLQRHSIVRQAVAVVREDTPGDQRLVAYVAPATAAAHAEELRKFSKEHLRAHMLPSALVFTDSFPLSPSGKIDRKALPAPEWRSSEFKVSCVTARTPTEEALANIWCGLLNLKQIGVHDNFFELGGHSLLAIQLRLQIQRTFKTDISLAAIYNRPTIEEIALNILQDQIEEVDAKEIEKVLAELESIPD